MSYRQLQETIVPEYEDPGIAPQRAVWVITVHAPITTPAPPGQPADTYSVYTVALDVATGFEVGLWAGLDAFSNERASESDQG